MNEQENQDYHATLLKQNRERIELAYEKAAKQGLQNPVVLVLDLTDDIARGIVGISERDQRIDEVVADAESRGVVPIGLWHVPGHVAANMLGDFPELVAKLREMPPLHGAFYTVVVGAGGASAILTPCP